MLYILLLFCVVCVQLYILGTAEANVASTPHMEYPKPGKRAIIILYHEALMNWRG